MSRKLKYCPNCEEEFYQENGLVSLEEWLWIKPTCGKCKKECCSYCLAFF